MDEMAFAAELVKLVPSTDMCMSRGHSEEMARFIVEELYGGYILKRRSNPVDPSVDDPMVRLTCTFDTDELEIRGELRFGTAWNGTDLPEGKILIGTIESDPVVLDRHTGLIELCDHAKVSFVMAQCANSGSAFLDAVILVAGFTPPYEDVQGLTESEIRANNSAAKALSVECARVAGIKGGPNIYETLLGYDSRIGDSET